MNFAQVRELTKEYGTDPGLVDDAGKYHDGTVKLIVVEILKYARA